MAAVMICAHALGTRFTSEYSPVVGRSRPRPKGSPVPSPHTDPDILLHERWFPNPLWMKVNLGLTALVGYLTLFLVLGEAAEDGPITFVAVFLLIVISMIALPIVVARAHVGVRLYPDRIDRK